MPSTSSRTLACESRLPGAGADAIVAADDANAQLESYESIFTGITWN